MSNNDTDSIKYILDEMDPAEKIEFEREVNRDPDLKIEVESTKRTLDRLNNLPKLSPPDSLSETVLAMAADQSAEKSGGAVKLMSVAVLLVSIAAGSFYMEHPLEFPFDNRSEVLSGSASSAANGAAVSFPNDYSNVQPWVNRDNILRLGSVKNGNRSASPVLEAQNQMMLKKTDSITSRASVGPAFRLTSNNR